MCDSAGAVRCVDPLAPSPAGPHVLVLEVGLRQFDLDVPGEGEDGHAAGGGVQAVVLAPGHRYSLHPADELLNIIT